MTHQDFLDLIKGKLRMEKHGSAVTNISCVCTGLEISSQQVDQKAHNQVQLQKPTCILAWCWFERERDSCWIPRSFAAEDNLGLPMPQPLLLRLQCVPPFLAQNLKAWQTRLNSELTLKEGREKKLHKLPNQHTYHTCIFCFIGYSLKVLPFPPPLRPILGV
uniref:Uncharacterized protein n=1 Tax=Mus musculus TaxID=10090 RepID=Q9D4N6_MOUSE|nr:unnamed protein product [Mus musculus]